MHLHQSKQRFNYVSLLVLRLLLLLLNVISFSSDRN